MCFTIGSTRVLRSSHCMLLLFILSGGLPWGGFATSCIQAQGITGGDSQPEQAETLPLFLRYDSGGTDNIVKAVQFSPDGRTLYAAGWNKVVQVYQLDESTNQFRYVPRQNFRVPVSHGRFGMIESMVVSPDGRWLAAAGAIWDGGPARTAAYVWPRSQADDAVLTDIGAIYVFDTRTRGCRVLRGHRGAVRQLTFVDGSAGSDKLVSVGFENSGQQISQSVRVWSVSSGDAIGNPLALPRVIIPPSTDISPRIRAWESTAGGLQVAVAAWRINAGAPASDLLIWNPLRGGTTRRLSGAPVAFALELSGQGQQRRLFCGGIGEMCSYGLSDPLRSPLRKIAGAQPAETPFAAISLPAAPAAPAAIAVVSIQRLANGDKDYSLSLVEGDRSRRIGRLWVNRGTPEYGSAMIIEPAIAVSPDGQFLSIAGSQANELRIFRTADLRAIRQPVAELRPLQKLSNQLVMPFNAVFVRKDGTSGIAVETAARTAAEALNDGDSLPPQSQSLIFDSTNRRVSGDTSGWTAAVASAGDWQSHVADDRVTVEVTSASGNIRHSLRLPEEFRAELTQDEVTAHAVCDRFGDNPPLAAVASHVQGEPLLNLYDAATGEYLRMLQGHDRRITSLSFSKDGTMLLSASLDGTVRGWLLTDLGKSTKGQTGWLSGLLVTTRDGQIIVDEVRPGSPASEAGLRKDDLISGIVVDRRQKPFKSAAAFYLHVSQTSPQQHPQITLRAQRQAQIFDVQLPLQQGADVREPLFSILLSEAPDAAVNGSHGWLVWSPQGQFDFVGQQLEQQLGWHINTGIDEDPVSYSSIDQYRDRFYHEGLLLQLTTDSHTARRPAGEPQIRLSLVTDDGQVVFPNYEDELVLRQPGGQLVLEFENRSGELVRSADWSLPDQPPVSFVPVERDLWKSSTSVSDLGRGQHIVHVRVITTDEPPVEFTQTVLVRYQPAAPELKLETPTQTAGTVNTDRLPLQVAVRAAVPATVSITHDFSDNQREEFVSKLNESGTISRELVLKRGRNGIRIVARNDEIPASVQEYASAEETLLETTIDYLPVGPPTITIRSIAETSGGNLLELTGGKLITDVPEVTLQGSIAGEQPLTRAFLTVSGKQTSLTGFASGTVTRYDFTETVRLEPGVQSLLLESSSGGDASQVRLDAIFRPRLPELTMLAPREQRLVQQARQDRNRIPLSARLVSAYDYPFQLRALINGIPADQSAVHYDPGSGLLSGELPLTPDPSGPKDEHRVELQLQNEWDQQTVYPLTIEFLHPPQLLDATVNRQQDTAVAELICRVRTTPSREITSFLLHINGVEMPAVDFLVEEREADLQKITLPMLPLAEGQNQIRIAVMNRDGRSTDVTVTEIVPPPPQKASLALINPLTSTTSMHPVQLLAFTVQSEPGLQRVDLIVERDHRRPQRIALLQESDSAAAAVDQIFEHPLELTVGVNRVRIDVQNRGGVTSRELSITYLPPPVTIQLTQLSSQDSDWSVPVVEPDGERIVFDRPADDGQAILNGKIRWLPGHRPPGDKWTVRVWVNGFLRSLRMTAPPAEAHHALFEVPIVLNQSENRMRIEAPEITFGDHTLALNDYRVAALQNIIVRCTKPEQRQRLHLVIMGVQMEDGRNVARADELKEFANSALRLEAPATAFAEIRNYAPLVGEKAVGRNLRTLMVLVETEIAQRRVSGRTNDVVMFYYRGREHRDQNGQFLLEDFQNFENPAQHPQSISESYLAGLFEHLPGAHVVFLDVENAEGSDDIVSRWPQFPNLGLFRIAWSGQQPVPLPPGPLLSAVRDAASGTSADGPVLLGALEKAFHSQLGGAEPKGRFLVETFVPDDLLNLVVARFSATAPTPSN